MDIQRAETALQASYGAGAARYRSDDDIEVTTPQHRRLAAKLAEISFSFGRPIAVLDVGCGTGRYFYCLQNVDRLVGMDITPEMLAAARQPVNGYLVSAQSIELVRGNVFFASFAPCSFDLIYSFGMFGHGCPVTVEVCDKLYSWLAPGGCLFFDTIDLAGLPWAERVKKVVRRRIYAVAPSRLKVLLDERQKDTPFFGLTRRELARILGASRFRQFRIASEVCESPLWQGRHLECMARLPAQGSPASVLTAAARDSIANSAQPLADV
jgi:SAM-dependent methyltransferase